MKRSIGFCGLACVLLMGCYAAPPQADNLHDLKNLNSSSYSFAASMSGLRMSAIRDTALSVGARGGLAGRAKELQTSLEKRSRVLDRIFNFQALMLDDHVLPPVLIEGRQTLNVANDTNIRISDRMYVIESQARFVTMPPTWRDYLWLQYDEPELPDRSLLPKNEDERSVWKTYVQEGWQAGRLQADNIYTENLGRLKRDMEGMLRYRTLLAQNMVSPPFVAKTDLGVTSGANDMSVNDIVYKITALPDFQVDSRRWKTKLIKSHSGLNRTTTVTTTEVRNVTVGAESTIGEAQYVKSKPEWCNGPVLQKSARGTNGCGQQFESAITRIEK